ncbi:MAG: type II toxin-antitoxin system ParD family antitoxin [Acetobacteraceae bacterium]
MNVSLTPKLADFVRRRVASGLYNNASEVIREALRLLVAQDGATSGAATAGPPRKEAVRAALAALEPKLRARGVASLALFGSVVRGDARPDSDIDVLIAVDPAARFSLVDLVSVKNFLAEHLGREVDVVTRDGIEPALRDTVFAEAERVF